MPTQDVHDSVTELRATIYGVQTTGGLVRRVDIIERRVDDHEKRLNMLSIKWLILMLLAGIVGNSVGSALIKTLTSLP